MAESETRLPSHQPILENERKKLKYLDFVQVAAVYMVVCLSSLHKYAKNHSGPLKPGVQTVEGIVRTIVGPVYDKLHDVPLHLLKFVDRKVDDSVIKLDHHVPSLLKHVSRQAWEAAQEVRRSGLASTAKTAYVKYEPTAKELYGKYEPVAEQYAVAAWRMLNRLPLFPQVAQVMVPTVAFSAEKYNQAVSYAAGKGYTVSYYLPVVPIERIANTFQERSSLDQPAPNGPSCVTVSQ
ncbi:stress-related protein-like [Andrographis paniculata]|uniref:stress-related protein-like n=1 Tax=Andrographis paniculata TaxID=175694 RepID=UPI0021E7F19A|nr:stress-related protein-like [Andrographis paniculata]